jgi:hypothetical protein
MTSNLVPGIPFTLDAHTYVRVRFEQDEGCTIAWNVRAGSPVDVYLVDSEQSEHFIGGEDWTFEDGESQVSVSEQTIELPFDDEWTLLIDNRSDENIPAYFDIRFWPRSRPWSRWWSWLL